VLNYGQGISCSNCKINNLTCSNVSTTPLFLQMQSGNSEGGAVIAIVVVLLFVFILTGGIIAYVILRRRKKRSIDSLQPSLTIAMDNIQSEDDFKSLQQAEIPFNELVFKEKLGAGAFGVVFKGEFRMIDVAIKQLKEGAINMKQLHEFRLEMKILKELRPHQNIITFLGVCTDEKQLCMVTAYCANGSLDKYLRNNEISKEQQLKWIKGIALGMFHLTKEGTVHRDLAARNVLLDEGLIPKISDFGLSRYTFGNSEEAQTTKSEVGPLKWMAPESLKLKQYSEKSDVWSFGVTCWEIINQQEPYPNQDPYLVSVQVLTEKKFPSLPPKSEYPSIHKLMASCFNYLPDKKTNI